ncbi:MAG: family 43 glycosylhydrolase [Prolixibacteraceae bacterium]
MKFLYTLFFILYFSGFSHAGQIDSINALIEDYIEANDPFLPLQSVIIESKISDVSICKGPNTTYFMTGTTGDQNGVQDGIKIWASYDLTNWNMLGENGYVWTFNDHAVAWQKVISNNNGWQQRGIMAPKIHYFLNTFWITYTNTNSMQSGVLKSTSGKAQGPYIELSGEKPMLKGTEASLFMESDSVVYVIWGKGFIQKLSSDSLTSIGKKPQVLFDQNNVSVNASGIRIDKINGKYVLSGSRYIDSWTKEPVNAQNILNARYDGIIATSDRLFGPYTFMTASVPHAGGGSLFTDFGGKAFFTISGADAGSPVSGKPCLIPLGISQSGEYMVVKPPIDRKANRPTRVYVSPGGNNSNGGSWQNAYTSLQRAIDNSLENSQIWIAAGQYEAPIQLNLRSGLYLYGGFRGNETALYQRDFDKHKVILSGKNSIKHVITIWNSSYIRLDGLIIQNGNASGGTFHQQYGGGVHILEGGETIRIVNCTFQNNKSNLDGGALYASLGAAPLILNCSFKENVANNNGGAVSIYSNALNGYHAKLYNCTFDTNFAAGDGSAIYFDTNSKKMGLLTVINCLLINNSTEGSGGTVALDRNSNLLLCNSTFYGNKGTAHGAVISNLGKVPARSRIANCIIAQNTGGTLFSIEGQAEKDSLSSISRQPEIYIEFSNLMFSNNAINALVQRNFDRKIWKSVGQLNSSIMSKNCVSKELPFVNAKNGNFHLKLKQDENYLKTTNNFYFQYNKDGQVRDLTKISYGCF